MLSSSGGVSTQFAALAILIRLADPLSMSYHNCIVMKDCCKINLQVEFHKGMT